MDLAVLDKLVSIDHLLKLLLRDEYVVNSVFLTVTRSTGRIGHAKAELAGELIIQPLDQGAFSGA